MKLTNKKVIKITTFISIYVHFQNIGASLTRRVKLIFMSKVFLIFISVLFVACSGSVEMGNIEDVSWLAGDWTNEATKGGVITKERWIYKNGKMNGKGLVLKNGDTTFMEILSLAMINDTLSYVADVPQNVSETVFKLTKFEKNRWKFENTKHDFPKVIEYLKTTEGFETIVSGGDRSFILNFKRD
jgi:hypothetical protein